MEAPAMLLTLQGNPNAPTQNLTLVENPKAPPPLEMVPGAMFVAIENRHDA